MSPKISSKRELSVVAVAVLLASCVTRVSDVGENANHLQRDGEAPRLQDVTRDSRTDLGAADSGSDPDDRQTNPLMDGVDSTDVDSPGESGSGCKTDFPEDRAKTESCCPEWGESACAGNLVCAALGENAQPVCRAEGSRQRGQSCVADRLCQSDDICEMETCRKPNSETLGAACETDALCPTDLECSDGTCGDATKVEHVSAGKNHTCALTDGGKIKCWGKGEPGEGRLKEPEGAYEQVSAGRSHNCALERSGSIFCWGDRGVSDPAVSKRIAGAFTRISSGAGTYLVCGIRTDGAVKCDTSNRTRILPSEGEFVDIATGPEHACAITSTGLVECWGDNYYGQATAPEGTFKQISSTETQSCAIAEDGFVQCWGGELIAPIDEVPSKKFTDVTVGRKHACAVDEKRRIDCWGNNQDGQLNAPDGSFTQISAGGYHTCAVTTDGFVECWGSNDDGESKPPPTICPPR